MNGIFNNKDDNDSRKSGALSGKMLLVRNVENNKIDYYFRQVRTSKC